MTKQEIKEYIGYKEQQAWNCSGMLCDYFVKVVNLKERKRYFLADIIVSDQEGDIVERFNDCEYNKQIFNLV